ncbi:MAG TPA: hypothetical protein VLS93_16540 [Anaeromyxobacteraceae bacterium]|nr:hypothetical protein [Anaeromyxobacteraceae bacterium]
MRGPRRKLLAALAIVAALAGLRVALAPRRLPHGEVVLDEAGRARAASALRDPGLDRAALLAALASRRVVLVGESHFLGEPPAWLTGLLADLRALDGRPAVLLLELPERMQGDLEAYRAGGDEPTLAAAWRT